ncbi:MAG TPA: glutamine-hydrolyzing GMP synthase, partial [Bacteroidetes bacterium]|nr:glutamine-hydrolyzing GMP synthase [Bacteroidota bacterium]
MNEQLETVLILDYGSQYTQLIARRCREEGVFSRIEPWDLPVDEIRALEPVGIILSGGPRSVYDEGAPRLNRELLKLGVPLLGICYGMHLLVISQGGDVSSGDVSEYGRATIIQQNPSRFFSGLDDDQPVWMSHGDHVTRLPDGWTLTAQSGSGIVAAVEQPGRKLYGVQFHPEVSHTPSGDRMVRNFLYDICGA